MPFLISADRNVNNVPTEPSPQHDLTNVSQNPIENINNPNSPSFRIEENANGNREFNLNLLTETIKCEEIISNSTAILIHFLVFSVVFFAFIKFGFPIHILFGIITGMEVLSMGYSVYRAKKYKMSIFYSSSLFLEFVNLILMTVNKFFYFGNFYNFLKMLEFAVF